MAKKQRKTIGSLQKAIDILNLFDRQVPELGTTEIANALELPKSTVAGLVFTLELNGYLDQNPDNRKYRLGFKLAERTGVLLEQFDLRQFALPVLEKLRDDCNESVNLAVRDGAHVVYIERMHGMKMLGFRSEIGKRERIHSTALGKAILSSLPARDVEEIVSHLEFKALTPRTITTPKAFLEALEETRRSGFAIDNEENELGGRCVAAPIFDYQGKVIAAVSISVPIQRLPESQIPEMGSRVVAAAQEISRRLGAPLDRTSIHR